MKKLRLDFENRIVNIVTDEKTVIAYMDDNLEKSHFLQFFPQDKAFEYTDNVTFDFENSRICLKKPVDGHKNRSVEHIEMPTLAEQKKDILTTVGWEE